MKVIDYFYNEEAITQAQRSLGFDFTKLSERKKAIMTAISQYQSGWVDEDKLEDILFKIFEVKSWD